MSNSFYNRSHIALPKASMRLSNATPLEGFENDSKEFVLADGHSRMRDTVASSSKVVPEDASPGFVTSDVVSKINAERKQGSLDATPLLEEPFNNAEHQANSSTPKVPMDASFNQPMLNADVERVQVAFGESKQCSLVIQNGKNAFKSHSCRLTTLQCGYGKTVSDIRLNHELTLDRNLSKVTNLFKLEQFMSPFSSTPSCDARLCSTGITFHSLILRIGPHNENLEYEIFHIRRMLSSFAIYLKSVVECVIVLGEDICFQFSIAKAENKLSAIDLILDNFDACEGHPITSIVMTFAEKFGNGNYLTNIIVPFNDPSISYDDLGFLLSLEQPVLNLYISPDFPVSPMLHNSSIESRCVVYSVTPNSMPKNQKVVHCIRDFYRNSVVSQISIREDVANMLLLLPGEYNSAVHGENFYEGNVSDALTQLVVVNHLLETFDLYRFGTGLFQRMKHLHLDAETIQGKLFGRWMSALETLRLVNLTEEGAVDFSGMNRRLPFLSVKNCHGQLIFDESPVSVAITGYLDAKSAENVLRTVQKLILRLRSSGDCDYYRNLFQTDLKLKVKQSDLCKLASLETLKIVGPRRNKHPLIEIKLYDQPKLVFLYCENIGLAFDKPMEKLKYFHVHGGLLMHLTTLPELEQLIIEHCTMIKRMDIQAVHLQKLTLKKVENARLIRLGKKNPRHLKEFKYLPLEETEAHMLDISVLRYFINSVNSLRLMLANHDFDQHKLQLSRIQHLSATLPASVFIQPSYRDFKYGKPDAYPDWQTRNLSLKLTQSEKEDRSLDYEYIVPPLFPAVREIALDAGKAFVRLDGKMLKLTHATFTKFVFFGPYAHCPNLKMIRVLGNVTKEEMYHYTHPACFAHLGVTELWVYFVRMRLAFKVKIPIGERKALSDLQYCSHRSFLTDKMKPTWMTLLSESVSANVPPVLSLPLTSATKVSSSAEPKPLRPQPMNHFSSSASLPLDGWETLSPIESKMDDEDDDHFKVPIDLFPQSSRMLAPLPLRRGGHHRSVHQPVMSHHSRAPVPMPNHNYFSDVNVLDYEDMNPEYQ